MSIGHTHSVSAAVVGSNLRMHAGMEYLHSRHVVHFDLKCDNLLADLRDPHRPAVKIGDLGLSKQKARRSHVHLGVLKIQQSSVVPPGLGEQWLF